MASRRKERILAFQTLYAWEISRTLPEDGVLPDFSRLLITGTIENINTIDAMIRSHLENWDISRLNRVDLAILRISVYELIYQTAPGIVINEAILISKDYGTDDSYRFINGVLDSIRKTINSQTKPGDTVQPIK